METLHYKIEGMDCSEEAAVLNKVIGSAKGVKHLEINVIQAKITIIYDAKAIDSGEIRSLIASTGMKAIPWDDTFIGKHPSFLKAYIREVFTFFCGLSIFIALIARYKENFILEDSFYLISLLFGVFFVIPKAFISLRHIRPDMNLLLLIAVAGALAIREWFEAAAVAFLFSLSLNLEHLSVSRAKRAINSLLDLFPPLVRVINTQGQIEEKELDAVILGERFLVRPGEKIPLDGRVNKGISSINQSPITGESIPVTVNEGSEVFAGTINEDGFLECIATKRAKETTLARIIQLVNQTQAQRSQVETWIDKFSRFYTPIMVLFALLVMTIPPLFFHLFWIDWIYRGLVFLVIACPCALVISTPVTIVSGLTSAARNGVLIKGGIFLENMGKLKALALDKTGTLTYGHPEIQAIVPFDRHTEEELLRLAAALEKQSSHPIAKAILKKAEERGIDPPFVEGYKSLNGKGAEALFEGQLYWIGSHRFMHEKGQETPEIHERALSLEDAGHTFVAIGNEKKVWGLLSVADSPRKYIRETLHAIKGLGIQEIYMLTGDNEPTAEAIASYAGIDGYASELLPEDKVKEVIRLKEKWGYVGMVGDGINDAPALAAANIGIAMAGMGTSIAIETSDIALMTDDLSKVPWLMRHSRKTLRIIKQNCTFALSLKALFIILAFFNKATLWMAIGADTGATLLVVFNALRLLKKTD